MNYLIKKNYFVINIDKVNYASNFYNTKSFSKKENYKFVRLDINNSSKLTIGFQVVSQGSIEINDLVYKFCEDKRYFDIDIIHIVGKNNEIINFIIIIFNCYQIS